MNGDPSNIPDFTIVDDEQISEAKVESENNKKSNENIGTLETDFVFNPSEVSLIQKKRHKLRVFDPKGIYTFKHIEIGYFQSFLHILSMCISLFLIIAFYYLVVTETQQFVTGLGKVSDLNVLDKLCMSFITFYVFFKIKKTFTTKTTNFDTRYRIALCANSLNRIVLNYLKLTFFFFAIIFMIILVEYPDKTVSSASDLFENGEVADSLSIITWFIFIVIVIKAFKYCGKGELK